MFYNSQRITKSGLKELAKKTKISEEQNIINNKQKMIDLRKKEKMKDLLIVKYMKKCGIKKPQLYLEEEINQFMKGEKLKKVDVEKINTKMKEILSKQNPKKKIIKSPTTIFTSNKLPNIDPSTPIKKKEKILINPIHSSLSSGNLKTTVSSLVHSPLSNLEQENKKDIPYETNTISSNTINRRKKKLYISPEEEIAALEKELGLDEKAEKPKRGYERLFKFFSEGNEWEAINKYNKELYEQEIEEEKIRKFNNKMKLREDLENQIKEKEKRDYNNSLEEQKYKQLFNEYNRKMLNIEKEKIEEQHKRILLEKKIQEEQIKAKRIKQRLEILREKKFDKNTLKAVQEELEKEKKFLMDKKMKESEIIKKDMKETEDNMKIKLEKLKKQKEDDKIFCQDLERTEEKNELERNRIFEKMRSLKHYRVNPNVKNIIEKIKKDEEEEDEKLRIYLIHKKKIEDEKEEREKNRRIQMNYDLKKHLEIQMEEKRKEREFEKNLWREQGKIWNIDSEKYLMEKKEIDEKIKKMNLKNAEKLREQIQYRNNENNKKKSMSIMEYSLNKNTLNKIMDSMENDKNK